MKYEICLTRGKTKTATFHGYDSQDEAVLYAQQLADNGMIPKGTKVTVRPEKARKNPGRKRRHKAKANPRLKTGTTRQYKHHTIRREPDAYTVLPYGTRHRTIALAKKWIDKHVREDKVRTSGKKRRPARQNPAKSRRPLYKRVDLSADRINWSKATTAEIRAIVQEAAKAGDSQLVAKAKAALDRRSRKR